MKKLFAITGASLLLVSLTGCAGQYDTFQKAIQSCGASSGVSVSDNGTTLSIDTMGTDDYTGASLSDAECIISAVNTPSYIVDNIYNTNAISGRQHDEWNGISVTYSYSDSNGLALTYHKN
jgi:hypothetical protein